MWSSPLPFVGFSLISSLMICPSEKWMILSVKAAMFSSWVTTITVAPALWSSAKISMISIDAAVSRFPVGSSARISGGSFARALAIATRCLCPPDISFGM